MSILTGNWGEQTGGLLHKLRVVMLELTRRNQNTSDKPENCRVPHEEKCQLHWTEQEQQSEEKVLKVIMRAEQVSPL